MNIYRRNYIIKLGLLLTALTIVGLSFWYSNIIVEDIAKEERSKIEMIANTFKEINKVEDDEYRSFLIDIIRNNNTVPVMLTDKDGNLKGHRNVMEVDDSLYKLDPIYKKKVDTALIMHLESIKNVHERIEIVVFENLVDFIYYDDSVLIKQLRYFPYVQFAIIGLFLFISYMTFNNARKAEQNQVWVGMAKETAHQLGTPISSLMGWIEYYKSVKDDKTSMEELIPEIEKDINRLEQVAERFSKIGSAPDLVSQDINIELEKTVNYFQKRAPKHISIELHKLENAFANINAPLFNWVIENLVSNAFNAIKDDKGYIRLSVIKHDKEIFIDVEDSGMGITKGNQKTIFMPGFTTRKRGWGLGLSLAKRIIEEYHKGKIYVKESKLGEGTKFRIELKS